MPDPQTSNLQLFIPLNGADPGSWDVPMNANFNQLDNCFGANVSIALSNTPVTLSAAQYNTRIISFTGTLTANVNVTFPAYGRTWIVQNNCVANTTFKVTTWISSAAQYVALPPSEPMMIMSDGSNIKFLGLGRVGTYWDFAGSAVPIWVTGSNPQPYLNCDGTAFSSAAYPALRDYLGSATLPDTRGRFRATLNQGTGRLTAINGNTLLANGGSETITQGNLPNASLPVTDPGHTHSVNNITTATGAAGSDFNVYIFSAGNPGANTLAANTGVSVTTGGSGTAYAPPGIVGGLTLIRAG